MENLYRLLLWTISSPIVETRTSSGMKVIGSPFARAAMTERQDLGFSFALLIKYAIMLYVKQKKKKKERST